MLGLAGTLLAAETKFPTLKAGDEVYHDVTESRYSSFACHCGER